MKRNAKLLLRIMSVSLCATMILSTLPAFGQSNAAGMQLTMFKGVQLGQNYAAMIRSDVDLEDCNVIMAVYGSSSRLVYVEAKPLNAKAYIEESVIFDAGVSEYPRAAYTVKMFAWDKNYVPLAVDIVPLSAISLDRTTYPLAIGNTWTGTNTYTGESYTTGDKIYVYATVDPNVCTDPTVTWTTSDENIAYLEGATNQRVRICAARPGIATITATAANGDTAEIVVTNIDNYDSTTVLRLSLSVEELTLNTGQVAELVSAIFPWDARNKSITWTSSNESVATVTAPTVSTNSETTSPYSTATVTALGAGTAVLTATTASNQRVAECTVTVGGAAAVTGISLNKTSSELTVGDTEQLTANVAGDSDVIWFSTAPHIVSVDQDGLVAAHSPTTDRANPYNLRNINEEAYVYATTADGGLKAVCRYYVNPKTVESWSVTMNYAEKSVPVDDTFQLTAVIGPSNATDKDIIWESDNPSVATITPVPPPFTTTTRPVTVYDVPAATLKGVSAGTATITARNGSQTATCVVTVTATATPLTSINLGLSTLSMVLDQVYQLKPVVAPINATNKRIKYTTSNDAIVTVDANDGTLMAYNPGTAVITATAADGGGAAATLTVTVTNGNQYIRNITVPAESITYNSALVLWNRDPANRIPENARTDIYVNGVYHGNSLRSETNAKDVYPISTSGANLDVWMNKMGYHLDGLKPDTEYTIRAEAFNTSDQLVGTETISIRTKPAPTAVIDVTRAPYNAVGDYIINDTDPIQRAINDCPAGGVVLIPEGKVFLTGALFIKDDVTLQLDGILMGSTNPKDYPRINTRWEGWRKVPVGYLENANSTTMNQPAHASLLNAGTYDEGENVFIGPFNVKGFKIVGKGMANANGYRIGYHEGMNTKAPRPNPTPAQGDATIRGRCITFHNAQDVYVQGVTIAYSPAWSMHAIYCDSVTWDSFDLIAKSPMRYGNTPRQQSITADGNCILNGDGINPDSASNCTIYDVYLCNGDDSVTLKSGRNGQGYTIGKATKYIRVTDSCSIGSKGGFAAGSEIAGGTHDIFEQNIFVEDCTLGDGIWYKTLWARGGMNEYIQYRDYIGNGSVFISMTYSSGADNPAVADPAQPLVAYPCQIRNLTFENVVISHASRTMTFTGINAGSSSVGGRTYTWPASRVSNVVVRNCKIGGAAFSCGYVNNFYGYNNTRTSNGAAVTSVGTATTNQGLMTAVGTVPNPPWWILD